jgi:predicted transcriptional regulator
MEDSILFSMAPYLARYNKYGQGSKSIVISTKFKISYKGFLNYDQLERYLTMLIESGLLRYDTTKCTFKTTEKGLAVVQAYDQMNQILK